jgi:hypothetical protein
MKRLIVFVCLLYFVLGSADDVETGEYKVHVNGECSIIERCPKHYYCATNGLCIKDLNGHKGSFCAFYFFKFCKDNLKCKSNICVLENDYNKDQSDLYIEYININETSTTIAINNN